LSLGAQLGIDRITIPAVEAARGLMKFFLFVKPKYRNRNAKIIATNKAIDMWKATVPDASKVKTMRFLRFLPSM
jgi:hypothetical protein